MKILKGFEALEYILKNKDAVLYSRNGKSLRFDKQYNRILMEPHHAMSDAIEINDNTMSIEWYTENKKKVLIKAYLNGKLQETQDAYFFNVNDALEKMIAGMQKSYEKRFNSTDVTIEYELYE